MKGHVDLSREEPRAVFSDGKVREAIDPPGVVGLEPPFAIAVREGQKLFLMRDLFGERSLFYCARGPEVWFSSDARELRALGAPLGQIDRDALSDYLELGYVPAPATMWTGVRKLPAGHFARFGPGGLVELRRYLELAQPGSSAKRPSRIAVRARLEETVKRALSGGETPAALLSADVDSGALVALMTRQAGRVRTFSVSFGSDDELAAARRIAHRFRSDHHELRLSLAPADEVPSVLSACGEPYGDASVVLLSAALRAIARECQSLLTADGTDELFAGHERYLRAARLPQLKRTGRAAQLLRHVAPQRHRGRLQKAGSALRSAGAPRARALVEIFSEDERRALLGSSARVAPHGAAEGLLGADAALAFDLQFTLPDSVLFRLGVAAARAGIAARPAFVDLALARAVVPPEARHKLGRKHGSRMLREAVADLLPRDVLSLPPRQLAPPLGAWLRGPLRSLLHDLVRSSAARIRALFDPRAVDLFVSHSLLPRGDVRQAWLLLTLELWAREQRG